MELVTAALVVTAILVFFGRILFRPNGISIEDLLRRTDLDWPRGVQEEDAVHWHTERLHQRSDS